MKEPDVSALYDEDSSQPLPTAAPTSPSRVTPTPTPTPTIEPSQLSTSFLRPGTLLGDNYEIVEELGVGGMGRVYLARDRALQRNVAVKLMRERAISHEYGETFRKRFSAEAMLPAQLSHPNIIVIFDRGVHEGIEYFAMEYVPGARTLKTVLDQAIAERRHLPTDLIAGYAQQAAHGLMALHSCDGVWHRDIKLDNLLVYDLPGGGQGLKLIDFGIAHMPNQELTQVGDLHGTPGYMSPEFFEVADDGVSPVVLDHRSDLFALGIVVYRLLTLRHPFPGVRSVRDAMAVYRSPTELPYLPTLLRPDLAPGWDYVVIKLLERNRDIRYQTARALLDDLRRLDSLGPYQGDGARRELEAQVPLPVDTTAKTNAGAPPAVAASSPPASADPPTLSSDAYAVVSSPDQAVAPAAIDSQPGQSSPGAASDPAALPTDGNAVVSSPAPIDGPQTVDVGTGESFPSASLGPGQWAAAWKPNPDGHRSKLIAKVVLAVAASSLVLGLGALFVFATDDLSPKSVGKAIGQWQMPGEKREDPDQWIADTKANPLFAATPASASPPQGALPPASRPDPARPSPSATEPSPPPENGAKVVGTRTHKARRATNPTALRHANSAAPAEPENPWLALYGSASRDLNTGTLSVRADGGPTPTTDADAKGQRLPAKLLDNVASAPTNAPVVAQLTKATTLGPHRVPAGSEIHGKTASSQGDRVFIQFEFIRLKNGSVITLQALARGRDGRPGIPGVEHRGSQAAGDIAATGASSTIRQVAGEAAEALGDAIGSDAIRDMGAASADKARGSVADAGVVIASRNTPFVVYVQNLMQLPQLP